MPKYVLIKDCEVFEDSSTGKAFQCGINGNLEWIPYSHCRARHINKKIHGGDSIEITVWLAEKLDVEGEPC